MSMHLEQVRRQVIPRWRRSQITAALGELASINRPHVAAIDVDGEMRGRVQDYNENMTDSFAADLVCAAIVLENLNPTSEAAAQLLQRSERVSSLARDLASNFLGERVAVAAEDTPFPSDGIPDRQFAARKIAHTRHRLRNDPRNAIAWSELSLWYAVAGLRSKSRDSMNKALALAGDTRYLLRVSTRLDFHLDEPDRALSRLSASRLTRTDPWVLAAEIAVRGCLGRPQPSAKLALRIVESAELPAFDCSELASALATEELSHGSTKRAKRLFRLALREPNENALAQAVWATGNRTDLTLDIVRRAVPRSYEAEMLQMRAKGEWESALKCAEQWLRDQPFSGLAAGYASYIAAVNLERYRESEAICRFGLQANPGDPTLVNNLAFALASQGRPEEADKVLEQLLGRHAAGTLDIALTATRGLICYRRGRLAEGRRLYEEAIDLAHREGDLHRKALAACYLAREEMISGAASLPAVLEYARELCRPLSSLELDDLLKRLDPEASDWSRERY